MTTVFSKAFVVIADTAVDPDSPVDTVLMTGFRDSLVNMHEWLGADYYAGAAPNHNHDGVNSASIPVGPNFLRNGSFEGSLAGWAATSFTAGTVAINTNAAYVFDGAQSLAITSTILADGGGTAETTEYVPCTSGGGYGLIGAILASIAGLSGKVEVEWYDVAKAPINVTAVYNSVSIPTAYASFGTYVVAPAGARFMRLLCTGGIPGAGTAFGTVYFDGLLSFALPTFPSGANAITQAFGNNSALLATTAYADAAAAPKANYDVGAGGLGAYIYGYQSSGAVIGSGGAVAGSVLKPSSNGTTSTLSSFDSVLSGTWRNISSAGRPSGTYTTANAIGMWQRIA